ncbi:MAG: hypothetical protein IJF59_01745 [Clostridia bacterium]|nr:hypothetical protein [Clostridia bacterium]
MLRGLSKQVIVVRNTGSDYFEEAIFIVNPAARADQGDLAAEARRLVAEGAGRAAASKRRGRKWAAALAVILLLAAAGGLAVVLL